MSTDITHMLAAVSKGDPKATHDLLPLVYAELRRLAERRLAVERPGQTLNPTALVHEAFLRLVGPSNALDWDSRGHFFGAAAEAMRRILIDQARRKRRHKHGGGRKRVDFDHVDLASGCRDDELLALDEALESFATKHPQRAALVKLRYFAGLTMDQAASALGISPATADRYWAYARAWLHRELSGPSND